MKAYAGIGSRQSPTEVLERMKKLAEVLAQLGYILRSGAAEGADSAFEAGCDMAKGQKEIYLPWPKFNGHSSRFTAPTQQAMQLAELYHPAWKKCTQGVQKLHARNMHQILGINLDTPVNFVLCWHKNKGGTMQAVRLAVQRKIPVFNLAEMTDNEILEEIRQL